MPFDITKTTALQRESFFNLQNSNWGQIEDDSCEFSTGSNFSWGLQRGVAMSQQTGDVSDDYDALFK
jgi:hypothetical protein